MRTDYLFYALAAIFFILTALSLAFVANQPEQSLSVVATAVLGLFSAGLGYYFRPKIKTTVTQPTEPLPVDTSDVHVREAHLAESVEKHVEPTVTPLTAANNTSQLDAPMPFITTPAPSVQAPLKSELTTIHGINEKRAAQLQGIGVNSIESLAKASADDLAKNLMISPKVAKMWIGTAKKQRQSEN